MNKYQEVLATFCHDIISDNRIPESELEGIFAPCIPHVFKGYDKSPMKIFYLGKETYGWRKMHELLECYRHNRLEEYLDKNNNVIGSHKAMIEYSNNKFNFWTFVIKLHIRLRTGEIIDDVNTLSDEQKVLLDEIGYGNVNSIETSQSNGIDWTKTRQETYDLVKQYSRKIDSLKILLDTYKPDLIVISYWDECDDIFEDLKTKHLSQYYINNLRAIHTIEGYPTKILWTSHPHRYSFLGYNITSAIKEMTDDCLDILRK